MTTIWKSSAVGQSIYLPKQYPPLRFDEILLRVFCSPARALGLARGRWLLYWTPSRRPQPSSAWADIKDALWQEMAHKNMPMTRDDYQSMTAYYRLAFVNIQQGSASEETWGCLALGTNMALILAEIGYGEDYIPLIQEAQEALLRAKARGEKARVTSWRMDGPGLKVLGDVLDVLDAQLEIATRGEIVEARNIILSRMVDQEAAEAES